jgi:hypothetical protein
LPSSSSAGSSVGSIGGIVSKKPTRENYLIWQYQILPEIRGAQLMGYLDGSVPEPSKTITSTVKGAEVTIPNPEYA